MNITKTRWQEENVVNPTNQETDESQMKSRKPPKNIREYVD